MSAASHRRLARVCRALAVSTVTTAGLVLAGCGGPPSPQPDPPGAGAPSQEPRETSPAPTQAPLNEDLACMLGQWDLDLADYSSQSSAYLLSLGIPLDGLSISGTYSATITPEVFGLAWGLQTDASVYGVPLSISSEAAGLGEWSPNTDGENWFVVSGWSYTIEPTVSGDSPAEPPSLFDPSVSAPIDVGCFGDALYLRGEGAPLSGNFIRRS